MFGCDAWIVYSYGRAERGYEATAFQKRAHSNCNHPEAWGWVAAAYLVFFCILGGQVNPDSNSHLSHTSNSSASSVVGSSPP